MTEPHLDWKVDADKITLLADGRVAFEDAVDHWDNAVLRLLALSDEEARAWCEAAAHRSVGAFGRVPDALAYDDLVTVLAGAWREIRPAAQCDDAALLSRARASDDSMAVVWATALPHDDSAGVVGPAEPAHGRLVDATTGQVINAPALEYEEEYFEGGVDGLGYGAYEAQSDWRMEKARRQVAQCTGVAQFLSAPLPESTSALDIGSGVGYFRAAAEAAGWSTSGVEVSRYAAERAREMFGLDTQVGSLADFDGDATFDLVTLWDCLEHVADPAVFLGLARANTKAGGLVMLRTPNIEALEREVFGNAYHSLKLEHLHYFSARSLAVCARQAELRPRLITTEGHLLRGFAPSTVAEAAATMRGSDFFAVLQAPK